MYVNSKVKIIFWNVMNRKENISAVIDYGIMNDIDIIAIIESPKTIDIKNEWPYRLIEHYDMNTKRGIELFIHKRVDNNEHYFRENCRSCILRLEKVDVNLVIAHLNSDLYPNGSDTRLTDIGIIMDDVDKIEKRYSSKSTLIIGDMNMNLFDDQMLSFNGFNARLFRYQMTMDVKKNHEITRDLLYNPMLSIYHDTERDDVARGTYYYDAQYIQWLCYDHILMKKALMDRFDNNTLMVVSAMGSKQLVKKNRLVKSISDHLPVYFELKKMEDLV